MLDQKGVRILPDHRRIFFGHAAHACRARPAFEFPPHRSELFSTSDGVHLYAAVPQVLDVAPNPEAIGYAVGKETEPNALDDARHDEPPRLELFRHDTSQSPPPRLARGCGTRFYQRLGGTILGFPALVIGSWAAELEFGSSRDYDL